MIRFEDKSLVVQSIIMIKGFIYSNALSFLTRQSFGLSKIRFKDVILPNTYYSCHTLTRQSDLSKGARYRNSEERYLKREGRKNKSRKANMAHKMSTHVRVAQ